MKVTAEIINDNENPPPLYPPEPRIRLEIPMDVARTLRYILGSVVGDGECSYRAHTSLIYHAIDDKIMPSSAGSGPPRFVIDTNPKANDMTNESLWRWRNEQ